MLEQHVDALLAIAATGTVISLFVIVRRMMRSSSTPAFLTSQGIAYVMAILLTLSFAATMFYLATVLAMLIPVTIAILATFAIHCGLFFIFHRLLPAEVTRPNAISRNIRVMAS